MVWSPWWWCGFHSGGVDLMVVVVIEMRFLFGKELTDIRLGRQAMDHNYL